MFLGFASSLSARPAGAREAYAPLTHSHNDYQREHPLQDALDHRFDSVEADIWLVKGEIQVSHVGFKYAGSLRDLYLDPIQKIVERRGSVYGDGKPFYLWLDIKDGNPELVSAMHDLLEKYPMLTTYTDHGTTRKPVSVILTGDSVQKSAYVNRYEVRKACRDSNEFHIDDPSADNRWQWYSLKWSDLFHWSGSAAMKARDQAGMIALAKFIHDKGRKVRFWDAPESDEFWQAATEARVDMLGTDHLSWLLRFVQAKFPVFGAIGQRVPASIPQ